MSRETFDTRYREMVINVVAAIGQAVLALVAGGVAGRVADPDSSAWIIGAITLFVGTVAAYAISNFVLLLVAPIALARAAKNPPAEPEPDDESDYTGFAWWTGVTTVILSIFAAATIAAIIVAASSDVAAIDRTLGYFLLAALPVALLTLRARRIVA